MPKPSKKGDNDPKRTEREIAKPIALMGWKEGKTYLPARQ
jgi:hypothetical protein